MKPLPLVLAAGVLALGLAWWWRTNDEGSEVAIAPAPSNPPVEVRTLALERPSNPVPERRAEAETVTRVPDPAPTQPSSPPTVPADESLGLEDLMREAKTTADRLYELTRPHLQAQIDSGQAEYLGGPLTTYHSRPNDNSVIFWITSIPDRGLYRPSLSRDQYPDLYELKDRLVRLNQLIGRREADARSPR